MKAPVERFSAKLSNATGATVHSLYGSAYKPTPDMLKGLDVLDLNDWRTFPAKFVRQNEFNAQTQYKLHPGLN